MTRTNGFLERLRQRRWPRRVAIGGAISVALFAVLGFFVVPPVARHVAQKQLGELLGRKVVIDRIRLNPFALSLTIEGFRIYETDQTTPFFGFSRLYVNAQLSSVFRRAPVLKEIAFDGLRLHVVRTKATADAWGDLQGAYNFSDIVARMAAMPKSPEPPSPAPTPRFSLNNIHVGDGAITFDDRPSGDHHEVTGLAIGVPFVSTLPVYLDSFIEPGLQIRIDGTPFAVQGRTKPFKDSLETVLELRLDALDLTRYLPFVPLRLPFAVASAQLSLALDVGFVRPRADAPRLTLKGSVGLAKVDVKEKRRSDVTPLLALERVDVRIGESDLTAQTLHLESILISGLALHVRRQRDGTLNLEHMAPGGDSPAPRHVSKPQRGEPSTPSPSSGATVAGPRFALDRFTLEKTAVHFRDESVNPPFETDVRDVAVSVRGLSNARGATATIEAGLRAVPGGTLKQQGTLRLTPLAATGKLTVDGVDPGASPPTTGT